jgi:hypothetical protein
MSNDNVISVTIAGKTTAEFLDNFWQVAKWFGIEPVQVSPPPAESASATVSEPKQTRRGRQTKPVETPAELPSDSVNDLFDGKTEVAPEEKKPVTMDEAKEAGRSVMARGGVDALRNILNTFKVKKVADLKTDQLESFVAQCEAV